MLQTNTNFQGGEKNYAEKPLNVFLNQHTESSEQRKIQIVLNQYYKRSLGEPGSYQSAPDNLSELAEIRGFENQWNQFEEKRIESILLPNNSHEFIQWYQQVNQEHKDKVRSFFQYLAKEASLEELAYYICLEEQVDGSFDDMIALAQLGVQGHMKLVMAANYWDEMGNGNEREMHTAMFAVSTSYMKDLIKDFFTLSEAPVAGLKNGNVLMMYALRRKYIPRLLGAIGILEDTASERFSATVEGLKRFNLPYEVIEYHEAHIHIDSNHGHEWLKHVLIPLVKREDKALIHEIAKGVLIRFNIASDYYEAIQQKVDEFKSELKSKGAL